MSSKRLQRLDQIEKGLVNLSFGGQGNSDSDDDEVAPTSNENIRSDRKKVVSSDGETNNIPVPIVPSETQQAVVNFFDESHNYTRSKKK